MPYVIRIKLIISLFKLKVSQITTLSLRENVKVYDKDKIIIINED
jgi:hypothetical protein